MPPEVCNILWYLHLEFRVMVLHPVTGEIAYSCMIKYAWNTPNPVVRYFDNKIDVAIRN